MENKYIINLNTGEQEIAPSTPLPDTFNITELHTFYYYHFAPNFEFCGEAHDYYEFFVVVDGNMITKTNLGSFPLKEREFIIVPPNVNHAMIPAKSNSSCSCISLSFSCDRALPSSIALKKNVITDAELNIINMIANDYTNNFVNVGYLTQIFSPQKDQYAYKQLLKNAIEILLILIYRQFSDSNNTANKKGNRSQNKVEEVKSYLDAHSNEKISLTDLSAQYGYTSCHLCRLFKKEYNETIINYLFKVRLRNALKLLAAENMPIEEVAHKVGFDDACFFTKIFKRYIGKTPGQYRKYCQNTHILNTYYIMTDVNNTL